MESVIQLPCNLEKGLEGNKEGWHRFQTAGRRQPKIKIKPKVYLKNMQKSLTTNRA